jgi:molybdenum cofactor cytidylyltransferase
MKFGPVPLDAAEGAILAHSLSLPDGRLRKGVTLGAAEVARLRAARVNEVIAARLGPGDVAEDAAAARLGAALRGPGLALRPAFTGRANLHAEGPGVVEVDAARIGAVNAVDPMITVATLPPWQRVTEGMMAATVKIIAYAVPSAALDAACAAAAGAMRLRPPSVPAAHLIVTRIGAGADDAKGVAAVAARLDRLGIPMTHGAVAHETDAVARALAGTDAPLRLILTASATSDADDVGPAALRAAGGRLIRFGMPVDPGNLLFLGEIGDTGGAAPPARVIGLPGCARSPALNGADWVLEREACGHAVTAAEIAAMGVGGLLKEIPTRPQPRERRAAAGRPDQGRIVPRDGG